MIESKLIKVKRLSNFKHDLMQNTLFLNYADKGSSGK